jgi:hypothetical protein
MKKGFPYDVCGDLKNTRKLGNIGGRVRELLKLRSQIETKIPKPYFLNPLRQNYGYGIDSPFLLYFFFIL